MKQRTFPRLRPLFSCPAEHTTSRCRGALLRVSVLLAVIGVCLTTTGCSAPEIPVEGTVSFAGEPISEGMITFEPLDQGTSVIVSEIRDGAFQATVQPGKYRVIFGAYRTADTPGPDGEPHTIQFLPAKFTIDSQVTVEVPREGDTKLDFDLQ